VKGKDGRYPDGEDAYLTKDVPGIDMVISGTDIFWMKFRMQFDINNTLQLPVYC
jgi:hypothetical protein